MNRYNRSKNTRLAKERMEKVLEALRPGPLTTPELKAAIGTKSDLSLSHLLTYNDLLRESGSKERLVAKQEFPRSKKFLWRIRTKDSVATVDPNPAPE